MKPDVVETIQKNIKDFLDYDVKKYETLNSKSISNIKVKAFTDHYKYNNSGINPNYIDKYINNWIEREKPNIIDIKYSVTQYCYSALVIYESKDEK